MLSEFAFGSLLIKRSCPAPNIGPKDPSHKIPLWFELPLSGILIGPVPEGFTRLNKNESLQYLYRPVPGIKKLLFQAVFKIHGARDGGEAMRIFHFGRRAT